MDGRGRGAETTSDLSSALLPDAARLQTQQNRNCLLAAWEPAHTLPLTRVLLNCVPTQGKELVLKPLGVLLKVRHLSLKPLKV